MDYRSFRIGDICSIVKGTYSSLKTEPGEFPLVVTADFRRTSSTFQLDGPAVCVPLISSTGHGDAALHRVHYQEGKFALANLLVALLPKDHNLCDPKYLYQLLMTKKNEYFVPLMLGTANVSLKERDIANVEIPLPALRDQLRIVARIEELAARIEEARELRRRAVEEANLLLYVVARKLREELLETDIVKSIGDITTVTSGGTPDRSNPLYWDGGTIPWIKTGELFDEPIISSEEKITEAGLNNSSAKLFPIDTILIALYGQGQTRGRTGLLKVQATTNQACAAILPQPEVFESSYLQYWLQSLYHEMRLQNRDGAQPNWNGNMIKKIKIALPSIPKQRHIVTYLDGLQSKTDDLKRHQAETAAELDALMPSILDRAFRGEL